MYWKLGSGNSLNIFFKFTKLITLFTIIRYLERDEGFTPLYFHEREIGSQTFLPESSKEFLELYIEDKPPGSLTFNLRLFIFRFDTTRTKGPPFRFVLTQLLLVYRSRAIPTTSSYLPTMNRMSKWPIFVLLRPNPVRIPEKGFRRLSLRVRSFSFFELYSNLRIPVSSVFFTWVLFLPDGVISLDILCPRDFYPTPTP